MTNQHLYGFILGRNPAIGATEIYLQFKNEITKLFIISSRLIIIGLKSRIIAPELVIEKIYGTVKIVELPEEIIYDKNPEKQLLNTAQFLSLLPKDAHRITFGFSVYNTNNSQLKYDEIKKQLLPFAYKLKKEFKANKYNANFLGLKEDEITTNAIKDKQMIKKGVDFAIIITNEKTYIGKTVAVQNTEDYEKRNYHRPIRNLKSGIMPIKLARTMIALSEAPFDGLVVDPFCGSGTIITELIIMGYTNISGSDNDSQEVEATKTNIQWVFENYPQLKEKPISWKIEVGDATLISRQYKPKSVQAIISEPYLGPIFKTNPSKETINQLFNYLTDLYLKFFKSASQCLKTGGKIIFVFPVIPINNRLEYMDILNDIQKIGFEPIMLLPEEWRKLFLYEITNRKSFLVKKEGQIMIRELFLFEKTR